MPDNDVLLRVESVEKSFPGVKALDQVSVDFMSREIHAVIGENGAGKSTLMKILSGLIQADSGSIILEGNNVSFRNPKEAMKHGICYVAQELNDFPDLSVAENIFASQLSSKPLAQVKRYDLVRKARKWLAEFDLKINPNLTQRKLSTSARQVVQIIRAMTLSPRVLILDEPTTSLDSGEKEELFNLLKRLNEKGVTILYITHHLSELFGFAHRVTVLRDGRFISTEEVAEASESELAKMMVGRNIEDFYSTDAYTPVEERVGEKVLEVKGISSSKLLRDVSFELNKREILGFFGLIGAGRTELFKGILGLLSTSKGEVLLEGKQIKLKSVNDAVRSSVAYLPEDRKTEGLFLELSILENIIAPQIHRFSDRLGFLKGREMFRFANQMKSDFNIIAPSLRKKVTHLSGGNQQKVLLAMWVGTDPKVLIVDEPTKGVDIATKQQIYLKLRKLSESGIAVIMVSSDLPEIIQLSDRVIVMYEGRITGEVDRSGATEEKIMELATGISNDSKEEEYQTV